MTDIYTNADFEVEAFLAHYGILGMKWGQRKQERSGKKSNDPNIFDKIKTKRIENVEKGLTRADTQISKLQREAKALEGSNNLVKRYERGVILDTIKDAQKNRKRLDRDLTAIKNGKLTSTQKKLLIGAAVAGAVVATGAILQGKESGALNAAKIRTEALLKGRASPFETNHELMRRMSAEEILKKVSAPVNPNYSSLGGKMNCRRSTFAHELRRRGFDVQATTAAAGTGQSESGLINALTPKKRKFFSSLSMSQAIVSGGNDVRDTRKNPIPKTIISGLLKPTSALKDVDVNWTAPISTSKPVLDAIKAQGNGARGEVVFKFGGFGHSLAYEVVDGSPKLFDSQKGKLYDYAKLFENTWPDFKEAEITRLDNADLDLNFLARWATNKR